MRMLRTPRCLRSFITDRQNEAASPAVAMSGGVLASLVIAGNDPRWKTLAPPAGHSPRPRNQDRNLLDGSKRAIGTREPRRPPAASPTCGGGAQFPTLTTTRWPGGAGRVLRRGRRAPVSAHAQPPRERRCPLCVLAGGDGPVVVAQVQLDRAALPLKADRRPDAGPQAVGILHPVGGRGEDADRLQGVLRLPVHSEA